MKNHFIQTKKKSLKIPTYISTNLAEYIMPSPLHNVLVHISLHLAFLLLPFLILPFLLLLPCSLHVLLPEMRSSQSLRRCVLPFPDKTFFLFNVEGFFQLLLFMHFVTLSFNSLCNSLLFIKNLFTLAFITPRFF